MSLIADALKKAQSARLGRRYLTPDPSGVLPTGPKHDRHNLGYSLSSILNRTHLSPALLVGLGSGVVLFVALFSYFFLARSPKAKSPTVASSAALEKRPAGLILTPPPSVPAVEPLVLEKEGSPTKDLKASGLGEKTPTAEKPSDERETAKSEVAKVEKKPSEPAKAVKPQKKSEDSKVAVTQDLSEEVHYHFNLALFYQEEKNFPLARREYEKVVQMWPLYVEAHNNLGVIYKELGMYNPAILELNKAVALNPRYPRAYHNLGVIYQIKGDWRQAAKNYGTALSLDRNHLSSYNNLGLVYRSQKRPHEAREVLEKALAINPYFPQTHYNLALVLEEMGEVEQARFHYQKFVDNAGEDNSRLAEKVRAYLKERPGKNDSPAGSGS
ncbi:tetratricopeptide repeat protein [bacterium]|nr:MAG: tetratricopeptide repeat protein [bacterium]